MNLEKAKLIVIRNYRNKMSIFNSAKIFLNKDRHVVNVLSNTKSYKGLTFWKPLRINHYVLLIYGTQLNT